jgi:hypothetical protein
MVTRPPQTGTSHPLPFAQLSPDDFERLTLWLVELEGYLAPQHWGQRGKDGGRDIIALRNQELWYFQCNAPVPALKDGATVMAALTR